MKQRYAEVKRLLERIADGFKARGSRSRLAASSCITTVRK
jgi:23S rRNA C2498 (ribose-2'-O)-methylase RlmM